MFVFEIVTPGTWLDYEDREWSSRMENQLHLLRSRFFEANAALNLFMKSRSAPPPHGSRVTWELDSQHRYRFQHAIGMEWGEPLTGDKLDEIGFDAEVSLKREKWRKGVVPREFENRLPLVYARMFLQAVNGFEKILGSLAREADAPPDLAKLHAKLVDKFPQLGDSGSSSQSAGDGSQTAGEHLHEPAHPDRLDGPRYGSVTGDGRYAEIAITPESMHHLQEVLEEALLSFRWRGPKKHEPGA